MKKRNLIIHTLFALYIILMLWLLFFQRLPYINYSDYTDKVLNNINLIPFRTILEYLFTDINAGAETVQHAFINLAGNIIMFVPLGFFLAFIVRPYSELKTTIILTLIIITVVEIIQLVTLTGSFDIDDLFLNTIGSVVGYGIQRIIFKNKH